MKGKVMALGVGSSRLQALGIKAGGRHAKISVESSEASQIRVPVPSFRKHATVQRSGGDASQE